MSNQLEKSVNNSRAESSNSSQEGTTNNIGSHLRTWFTAALTVAGLAYLVFILVADLPKDKRFGYVEATIFGIILIVNSEFIARLQKLKLSGEGVEFLRDEVERKIKPVERRQDEIDQLISQQKKVMIELQRTQEIQDKMNKEQRNILGFLVLYSSSLVADYEITHLKNLKHLETNSARDYDFPEGHGGEALRNQFRKLANLRLIVRKKDENNQNKRIDDMRGPDVDITDYVEITPEGKKFLELWEQQQKLRE